MFDYSLILVDGSVDCDGNASTSFDEAITTSLVTASGAKVVDLGEGGTPVGGLAVVMFIPALASSNDTLVAKIETCDEVAMAGVADYKRTAVMFDIAGVTTGTILASECTSAVVIVERFATEKRYVRASLTPAHVDGGTVGNMGKVKVYLTPFPFVLL